MLAWLVASLCYGLLVCSWFDVSRMALLVVCTVLGRLLSPPSWRLNLHVTPSRGAFSGLAHQVSLV